MFQLFKVIRVSIYVGTLFLFQNCSSQLPSIWVLRDVQSLDAKVMSTVQWLKIEKSNVKFLYCLLYTSPSPRDVEESRMPSSA